MGAYRLAPLVTRGHKGRHDGPHKMRWLLRHKAMCHVASCEPTYGLSVSIDPAGNGVNGAGYINRGEDALIQQKAMISPVGIFERTHDLAHPINPPGLGECGAEVVDRGEEALIQQIAMESGPGIKKRTHDLATVIDPICSGPRGTEVIDRDECAPVQQIAMEMVPVKKRTHDLATFVYPRSVCENGAGDINHGECALIQQKAMCPVGIVKRTHDLARPIYPIGIGEYGAGEIDSGEDATSYSPRWRDSGGARRLFTSMASPPNSWRAAAMAPGGIFKQTHDLATIIDPPGEGVSATGDIDRGKGIGKRCGWNDHKAKGHQAKNEQIKGISTHS